MRYESAYRIAGTPALDDQSVVVALDSIHPHKPNKQLKMKQNEPLARGAIIFQAVQHKVNQVPQVVAQGGLSAAELKDARANRLRVVIEKDNIQIPVQDNEGRHRTALDGVGGYGGQWVVLVQHLLQPSAPLLNVRHEVPGGGVMPSVLGINTQFFYTLSHAVASDD